MSNLVKNGHKNYEGRVGVMGKEVEGVMKKRRKNGLCSRG